MTTGWGSTEGIITLVREESDQVFLVYAGYRGNLAIPPLAFFARTRLLERNLAFFRDAGGGFYQGGVSESVSSFQDLIAWQRAFLDGLSHVRRVYCLGTSMGAYTALLCGHLLGADEVWAFSPPTTWLEEHMVPAPLDVADEHADLARLLADPRSGTVHHVHYNEGCTADADAAMRLARCPGVRLHPHPGDGHDVVRRLAREGILDTLLPPPG